MHELSLVEGIISQVRRLREIHGFSLVREIEIVCGRHNSVNEGNLEFILAHQDDPCLKQTRISLARLSKKFYCTICDVEFDDVQTAAIPCVHGGTGQSCIPTQSALYIRKLEVD